MFCKKEITLEEQCTVKFVPFFGESVADRLPLRQGFGTIKEQR